ncbi:protein transport protein Sec24A-like [Sinocyclocheilus grahami]|uniref:protein transport protein Sec24A-like n=1 Tax=Sinocyclocheilus grahami TaxID=75366 RepID=UPI0007AC957D|nr:PREDICTED: protein transport protein Sec24A-like [Sinocyclocheilus grahami]
MSSGGFASQNGAGGSHANGPSQNPVGVFPCNQRFMAPPQPGFINTLPSKGPPPAGPSLYSNSSRPQPSPVGTLNHSSYQHPQQPISHSSSYQHPQQPISHSSISQPPQQSISHSSSYQHPQQSISHSSSYQHPQQPISHSSISQHPQQSVWSPAGSHASPVPPVMHRSGTSAPPVLLNTVQPPAPSVNTAALTGFVTDSFVLFCAAGPSQNPVGVFPCNQRFMAPPQPGFINTLPSKGPPPAGPSLYSNSSRPQPSPVGTLNHSSYQHPQQPISHSSSYQHPQQSISHSSSYQHPQQPISHSSISQPPQQPISHSSISQPPQQPINHSSISQHPQQPISHSSISQHPQQSVWSPAGSHASPVPPVMHRSGTSAPPVLLNTVQPPAPSVNTAALTAPPALSVMALHQTPAAVTGPLLAAHSDAAAVYPAHPAQMHGYPSLQPVYRSVSGAQTAPPAQTQLYTQPSAGAAQLSPSLASLSLQSQPPEALRAVNLLQERSLLPPGAVPPPVPCLPQDLQKINCSPEVFRCTLTSIPQTQSLLNKAKLPLGLLLHPFKDLSQLPVVTSSNIVRCRSCRTYINPFVTFLDARRWKCNLCHRVNDVPEEFMYNPVSRLYGAPHKRPEVQNATIEFIAPSEYMLRPPQPAAYLFVLDVSHNAVETGYLDVVCQTLLESLDSLPGDTRTKIGFITFDSNIHFYNLQEGLSQPQMLIVSDIDDVFLPTPDSLLVNLSECRELVQDLLASLPQMFGQTMETQSALGPALQAAFKLLSPTGGRMTVFQTQLPTIGIGALKPREEPSQRANAKDVQHLSPATDFYKKLALDCSGHHVAVDLFLLSAQYSDLSSLGCISRYSAGSVYFYPSYHKQRSPPQTERLQKDLKRYLTRKIGFEAVMRVRCTKGLSIHTFHGNFFVRSTDLLSLPNVNPDAGFAVQMSIEENLLDLQTVSFQAALLYTSSKGERRIRVHTLCLPVVNSLSDIFAGADVQAITALLASMAVDRCVTASLSDARDALINAAIDSLASFRSSVLSIQQPGLLAPACLRLFPLYILALLKHKAFRTSGSSRLDERVFAMCQLKQQPLVYLMMMVHPGLYRVDELTQVDASVIQTALTPHSSSGSSVNVPDVWSLTFTDDPELLDESPLKAEFMQNMIEDLSESALSYYEFLLHLQQQISK